MTMHIYIAIGLTLMTSQCARCMSPRSDDVNHDDHGDGDGLMQVYIDLWQEVQAFEHLANHRNQSSTLRVEMDRIHDLLEQQTTAKSRQYLAQVDELTHYVKDEVPVHNKEHHLPIPEPEPETRKKRSISKYSYRRWDYGYVPFIYDNLAQADILEIRRAHLTYKRYTCIRFVPWSRAADGTTTNDELELGHQAYLKYVDEQGCWSFVGKVRADQLVSCCSGIACLHENGHALGLHHEHQSPHQDTDWMIRQNIQNVNPNYRSQYRRNSYRSTQDFIGYDISTYMHYLDYYFSIGGKTMETLFPEFQSQMATGMFYMMKEVSLAHSCAEEYCDDVDIECENEGYLTEVDGVCKCMCLPGLDPTTGCTTLLRSGVSTQAFPTGRYALPEPETGCRIPNTEVGTVIHHNQGDNSVSDMFNIKSDVTSTKVEMNFCVIKNIPKSFEEKVVWPAGNYCIYRTGGTCPEDFESGYVQYDDVETSANRNSKSGSIPDGTFNQNTRYEFCCRSMGFSNEEIFLPNEHPFVLVRNKRDACQKVRGMHVYDQKLSIQSSTEDGISGVGPGGVSFGYPIHSRDISNNRYTTTFCYYTPANMDCGDIIDLSETKTIVTIAPPTGSELECTWYIKSPEKENILLSFDEFNIDSTTNNGCKDRLEIRYARAGQPGFVFQGGELNRTFGSIYNTMLVKFSTCGSSESTFSATARLVSQPDLCYNLTDRGVTYTGKVNVTRFYEQCIPWTKAHKCHYNAYGNASRPAYYIESNAILDENYCRNPDYKTGIIPWCYTNAETCERNYCDPCQLGTVYDVDERCQYLKELGKCDQKDVVSICAKTCGFSKPEIPGKYSEVTCPRPPEVSDAVIISNGDKNGGYRVGEIVGYQCKTSSATLKDRFCLSSGQWSPMGHVCDFCESLWTYEGTTDSCYIEIKSAKGLDKATEFCENLGGEMAKPKTEELNNFIKNIITTEIHLPMTLNGYWKWDDGSRVDWFNWGIPPTSNKDKCAYMTSYGDWTVIPCNRYKVEFVCQKPKMVSIICTDFSDNCENILESNPNTCQENPAFARRFCPFSCGFCDETSTPMCDVSKFLVNKTTSSTTTDNVSRGTVVEFFCEDGYQAISGDRQRICLSNGELSGTPLVCSPKCPAA